MGMKLEKCQNCGYKVFPDEDICPNCGYVIKRKTKTNSFENSFDEEKSNNSFSNSTQQTYENPTHNTNQPLPGIVMGTLIFMVIGIIFNAVTFPISLLWTIPITGYYYSLIRKGKRIELWLKIVSLIFVNIIAGVLMLADKDR